MAFGPGNRFEQPGDILLEPIVLLEAAAEALQVLAGLAALFFEGVNDAARDLKIAVLETVQVDVAVPDRTCRAAHLAEQFFHFPPVGAGEGGLEELESGNSAASPDPELVNGFGFIVAADRLVEKVADSMQPLGERTTSDFVSGCVVGDAVEPLFKSRHESPGGRQTCFAGGEEGAASCVVKRGSSPHLGIGKLLPAERGAKAY